MEKVYEQYLDALVTVELAVEFAKRDKRKINQTIRACWAAVRPRITETQVIKIFDGLCKQPFPDGALKMLRRQLELCTVKEGK